MKYSIEISDDKLIEKIAFNGKEYTKTWEETPRGLKCKDKRFDEQIEADGCDNEDILNAIYNVLERDFFPLAFWIYIWKQAGCEHI